MGTKLITDALRSLYPNFFTPRAMDDNEQKKYSVIVLIDKSDAKTLESIKVNRPGN